LVAGIWLIIVVIHALRAYLGPPVGPLGRYIRRPIAGAEDNRAGLMSIYEEKLRQWPVPYQTFFLATRYGKTHVIASGDPASPPVVLLHPEATSALAWSPLFPALAGPYRTYAPDTIGDVGRSELDDFDVYPRKGGDFSAWLGDIYAEVGITRADVMGARWAGSRCTARSAPRIACVSSCCSD
jgi:hypothetical protein